MTPTQTKRIRCAIYTRKSSEEGLEQEFNSLDAQRDAGEAYIQSQKHEGWMLVAADYNDGGYSGSSMERPGLQQLLADIRAGLIDVVVVYKVDRLSRSLTDFAHIVQVFEAHNVSFVSVTQHFNTSSSMGRLTLNILLSFAQFEREVIGERIRDKFAASKKKGMWMGGQPPLGYDIFNRKLVVNPQEAEIVRHIFTRFTQLHSVTDLVKELERDNIRTKSYRNRRGEPKGGRLIDKGFLYRFFRNRLYLGETVHKSKSYPGQHDAIVPQALWDDVHKILARNPASRGNESRRQYPALLRGMLTCGCCGCSMTPNFTRRHGKEYRYYTPITSIKKHYRACAVGPVPAAEIEELVIRHVRQLLQAPEVTAQIWQACKHQLADDDVHDLSERDVFDALQRFDSIWHHLLHTEQQRLLQLLVQRVVIHTDRVELKMLLPAASSIVRQLQSYPNKEAAYEN